jgi:hypothetical protein
MVGIGGHITTLKLLSMNIDLMLIKPRTKHGFKAKYIFNYNFSTSLDVNHFQIQSIMVAYESLRNQEFFFQNPTLGYMTKTLNQIIFFSPIKISEYFFQQHWESEYFFRKKP